GAWLAIKGRERATPIPSGPFLAIAGWIVFMWGDGITGAYKAYAGLSPCQTRRMAPYTLALTAGTASGKSEVERRFRALGIHVADADVVAREVVEPGTPGLADIVEVFGPDALDASGNLDRLAMRRRVFADADARRRLEAIIHPRVRTALRAACEAAPGPYAVAAIPLFVEA